MAILPFTPHTSNSGVMPDNAGKRWGMYSHIELIRGGQLFHLSSVSLTEQRDGFANSPTQITCKGKPLTGKAFAGHFI